VAKAIGGGAGAVIDTVAYDEGHARQLLGIEEDVGAFVVISSVSIYRDDEGRTLDEAGQTGFPELPEPTPETQPTVDPGRRPTRRVRWLSNEYCSIMPGGR
jgi:L-aminopeptidase/D-esterase-like protein